MISECECCRREFISDDDSSIIYKSISDRSHVVYSICDDCREEQKTTAQLQSKKHQQHKKE